MWGFPWPFLPSKVRVVLLNTSLNLRMAQSPLFVEHPWGVVSFFKYLYVCDVLEKYSSTYISFGINIFILPPTVVKRYLPIPLPLAKSVTLQIWKCWVVVICGTWFCCGLAWTHFHVSLYLLSPLITLLRRTYVHKADKSIYVLSEWLVCYLMSNQ